MDELIAVLRDCLVRDVEQTSAKSVGKRTRVAYQRVRHFFQYGWGMSTETVYKLMKAYGVEITIHVPDGEPRASLQDGKFRDALIERFREGCEKRRATREAAHAEWDRERERRLNAKKAAKT